MTEKAAVETPTTFRQPEKGHWYFDWALLVPLALAVFLVGWQLVAPPIIGLADNGDFDRLTRPFGLHPRTSVPDDTIKYVTRMWDFGPWRLPSLFCSSLLLVLVAMLFNVVAFRGGFDLVAMGIVHGLVFIGGLLLLGHVLWRTGWSSWRRMILGVAGVLILCDTAHVAYLNSFYVTAATFAILPWVAAFFLRISLEGEATEFNLRSACAASCLFIWSKPQLAFVGFVLAALLLRARRLTTSPCAARSASRAAMITAVASLALFAYPMIAPNLRLSLVRVNTYHAVFTGLLAVSPTPESDLVALGVSPSFVKYQHIGCLQPGGPNIRLTEWRQGFFREVGFGKLLVFYVTHPSRLTALLRRAANEAFPHPPFWSTIHEKQFAHSQKEFFLWNRIRSRLSGELWSILATPLFIAVAVAGLWRRESSARRQFAFELLGALCLLALSQFLLVPIVSGFPEISRHLYPFCLLFDWSLLGALAVLLSRRGSVRTPRSPTSSPPVPT